MIAGHRGQSLRQQVVQRVARFHFDDISLATEMFDVVNQQKLNAAVFAFGQDVCTVV